MPAKPLPISKPLQAGSDRIPLPRSASSRSKTGSPQPAGTPRATKPTTPPKRVATPTSRLDRLDDSRRRIGIGAPGRAGLDVLDRDRVVVDVGVDVMHSLHPCQDLDTVDIVQPAASEGGARHPADGLPGRTSTTSAMVTSTVFGQIAEVGVTRPEDVLQMVVGSRLLVGVANEHRHRCPGGRSLEDPGQDLDVVALLALGDQSALTGSPPIEIGLNLGDRRP